MTKKTKKYLIITFALILICSGAAATVLFQQPTTASAATYDAPLVMLFVDIMPFYHEDQYTWWRNFPTSTAATLSNTGAYKIYSYTKMSAAPEFVWYGHNYGLPYDAPVKSGYSLISWYCVDVSLGSFRYGSNYYSQLVLLGAVYGREVVVTFDLDNGTVPINQTVYQSPENEFALFSYFYFPTVPIRAGYVFKGWSFTNNGVTSLITKTSFYLPAICTSTVFTAVWEQVYDASNLCLSNGFLIWDSNHAADFTAKLLVLSHEFDLTSNSFDLLTISDYVDDSVIGDVTFTVQYYAPDGLLYGDSISIDLSLKRLDTPVLQADGLMLMWQSVPFATYYKVYYADGEYVTTTQTFYDISQLDLKVGSYDMYVQACATGALIQTTALFSLWAVPSTLTVMYVNANTMYQTYSYGDVLVVGTPVRDGYVFTGWYTDPDLTERFVVTNETLVTSDLTLYAGWLAETPTGPPLDFWQEYGLWVVFCGLAVLAAALLILILKK